MSRWPAGVYGMPLNPPRLTRYLDTFVVNSGRMHLAWSCADSDALCGISGSALFVLEDTDLVRDVDCPSCMLVAAVQDALCPPDPTKEK